MDISNFFSFSDKIQSSTIQAGISDDYFTGKEYDPSFFIRLREGAYTHNQMPIIYDHIYGKHFKDVLGTGCTSLFLISDNMKKVLDCSLLTGWKTYPIIFLDKKNK